MRELTLTEVEAVSGAQGPLGAAAGAAVGGIGYLGAQAGAGSTPTLGGATSAVVAGGIAGFFTPTTTAQAAGLGLAGFYAGFGGGLAGRALNGGGGGGGGAA